MLFIHLLPLVLLWKKKKCHALAGNDSVFQDDANTSRNAALAEPYRSGSASNTCRVCAE